MKKIFSAIAFAAMLMATSPAWADDAVFTQYDRLYVQLHDGTEYEIPIDTASVVHSYALNPDEQSNFVIDIDGREAFYQFRRDEVAIIKMVPSEIQQSGIRQIQADPVDSHACRVKCDGENILVHASLEGRTLYVIDMTGRVIDRWIVSAPYTYSLSEQLHGIFMITIDQSTLKISKQ